MTFNFQYFMGLSPTETMNLGIREMEWMYSRLEHQRVEEAKLDYTKRTGKQYIDQL